MLFCVKLTTAQLQTRHHDKKKEDSSEVQWQKQTENIRPFPHCRNPTCIVCHPMLTLFECLFSCVGPMPSCEAPSRLS